MKNILLSDKLVAPAGPFCQAVEVNGMVYTSGQLPFTPEGTVEVEDLEYSVNYCLNALEHLAREVGSDRNDIVKVTVFVDNIEDYPTINKLYADFFEGCSMPARSLYEVAKLPFGVKVEMEAIIVAKNK